VIGYPFYFETSALLYNKTYLEDLAESRLQAEADIAAGRSTAAGGCRKCHAGHSRGNAFLFG